MKKIMSAIGRASFGGKKLLLIIPIILLAAACNKQPAKVQPAQNQQSNLVAPTAPALNYSSSPPSEKAFVAITWNYDVADYFNIYRSTDQNNWQKILANYPQSAHAATDSGFPKDAKILYYRITSTDGKTNESQPSPAASVNLFATEGWKTYTNSQGGFSFQYPQNYSQILPIPGSGVDPEGYAYFGAESKSTIFHLNFTKFSGSVDELVALVKAAPLDKHGVFSMRFSLPKTATKTETINNINVVWYDNSQVYFITHGFGFMIVTGDKNVSMVDQILSTFKFTDAANLSNWKTYTNTKQKYSFQYPAKLSLSVSGEAVNLSHSIPFENRDGGCDLKGDAKLSKILIDFDISINVVSGEVNPPYVDGSYSKGVLNGKWTYMGAEGCGQTNYYFPTTGNRTLVVTKNEVQILSPVVTEDVRKKVLAVPGVISYEESKVILDQILATFKFVK